MQAYYQDAGSVCANVLVPTHLLNEFKQWRIDVIYSIRQVQLTKVKPLWS